MKYDYYDCHYKNSPEKLSFLAEKRSIAFWIGLLTLSAALMFLYSLGLEAAPTKLPGADVSDKLEAAGTILHIIDTGLFKWGARIFAGICVMSSAWSLKEQRFGIAIISIVGAIIFGTAPMWVKNIFSIGGGDSVFGMLEMSKFMVAKISSLVHV